MTATYWQKTFSQKLGFVTDQKPINMKKLHLSQELAGRWAWGLKLQGN
jgi:hypothetical protein